MIQFVCFYIFVYFKTLQTKTNIDPDKISKEVSRNTINKLLESLERRQPYEDNIAKIVRQKVRN